METLAILVIVLLVNLGECLKCYKKESNSNFVTEVECGTTCYSKAGDTRIDDNRTGINVESWDGDADERGCTDKGEAPMCEEVKRIDGKHRICYCGTNLCNTHHTRFWPTAFRNVGSGSTVSSISIASSNSADSGRLKCFRKSTDYRISQVDCDTTCYSFNIAIDGSNETIWSGCYEKEKEDGCLELYTLTFNSTYCFCNTNLCNYYTCNASFSDVGCASFVPSMNMASGSSALPNSADSGSLKCFHKEKFNNKITQVDCDTTCYIRRIDNGVTSTTEMGCYKEKKEECFGRKLRGKATRCFCNTNFCNADYSSITSLGNVVSGSLKCFQKGEYDSQMTEEECDGTCYSRDIVVQGVIVSTEKGCYTRNTLQCPDRFAAYEFETRCFCNTNLCNPDTSSSPITSLTNVAFVSLKCFMKGPYHSDIIEVGCDTTCYSRDTVFDGKTESSEKGCHYQKEEEKCSRIKHDFTKGELCFCNTDSCNVGSGSLKCVSKKPSSLEMEEVECDTTCYSKYVKIEYETWTSDLSTKGCYDSKEDLYRCPEDGGTVLMCKVYFCDTNLCNVGNGCYTLFQFLFPPLLLVPYVMQRIIILE